MEPLCYPYRASILKGKYPHKTVVLRNGPPQSGVQTFRTTPEEG